MTATWGAIFLNYLLFDMCQYYYLNVVFVESVSKHVKPIYKKSNLKKVHYQQRHYILLFWI